MISHGVFSYFNPRTHEGCDRQLRLVRPRTLHFNPRTHEGCDARQQLYKRGNRISIHAPTKGATLKHGRIKRLNTAFQSTHPRRVRPAGRNLWGWCRRISIHAPTKGATRIANIRTDVSEYFNPRTHEGCDYFGNQASLGYWYFNPRTHEGCDERNIGLGKSPGGISIHAPTKGATLEKHWPNVERWISIHAPTKGATAIAEIETYKRGISIHAPTKGATFIPTGAVSHTYHFNPRTHEGCDGQNSREEFFLLISIHAPTKGATHALVYFINVNFISIHAPTKGATHCCSASSGKYHISIHAPTKGATSLP